MARPLYVGQYKLSQCPKPFSDVLVGTKDAGNIFVVRLRVMYMACVVQFGVVICIKCCKGLASSFYNPETIRQETYHRNDDVFLHVELRHFPGQYQYNYRLRQAQIIQTRLRHLLPSASTSTYFLGHVQVSNEEGASQSQQQTNYVFYTRMTWHKSTELFFLVLCV